MPESGERFDTDSVREDWDRAANAHAEGQATGRDYYRLDFVGPTQVALCGDMRGLRLLDVGCGTGYFAREMARRGATVTAVDLSPAMLAHARTSNRQRRCVSVTSVGDATRLPEYLGCEAFDIATSCMAQDMPDIEKVLQSVHACLCREGGW